jgi:hypothetical protein
VVEAVRSRDYAFNARFPACRAAPVGGESEVEGMRFSSRVFEALQVVVLGALMMSALAASPALARKGSGTQSTGSEQCWVTPNPAEVGYDYTVWGSGFMPGMVINVLVQNSLGTAILLAQVGADGTFGTGTSAQYPGTHVVYVRNSSDRRATNLAQCAFAVVY